MPLTSFQSEVLSWIAANRSIGSHIAGGLALNASDESARFSSDIDIFHDAEEAVIAASEQDCVTLSEHGCELVRLLWEPSFRRARVIRHAETVIIDWAHDAAWRFFPVERDAVLGWRLHRFDALTNKALAMGARAETRDLVDLVSHQSTTLPLAAIVWAACGKDPGFTPLLLLEQMRRNARIDPVSLSEMSATLSAVELKSAWLTLADEAERAILHAAGAGIEPGIAFTLPDGTASWHSDPSATPHRPTLGGVIPRLRGLH